MGLNTTNMSKAGDEKFKKGLDDLVNASAENKKKKLPPKDQKKLDALIKTAHERKKELFSNGETVMTFIKASEALLISLNSVQERKGGVDPSDISDMLLATMILFDEKKIIKIL